MSKQHQHGGDVFALARTLGTAPERLLDFSASINPLGMAPGVREALHACLDRLVHYPDKGAAELRERLAAYHGVAPEEIAVASGSTELIHLLPRAVPGRRGLIVAPAFAEYAEALTRMGWDIDYFTLEAANGFRLSLDALEGQLAEGYDLLFICNPANPTGALIEKARMAQVIELCQRASTFLVLDEAFIDFCEEESAKDLMVTCQRGVLLRSMTKFFAIPGLRLGYAIGNRVVIASLASVQDPWSVNTAAQAAGLASLADPAYIEETRRYVVEERKLLAARLDALGWLSSSPASANYLLVEIRSGMRADELRTQLLPHGIVIRDCSNFKGLDHRFFRVAVRLREENERLVELLARLGERG